MKCRIHVKLRHCSWGARHLHKHIGCVQNAELLTAQWNISSFKHHLIVLSSGLFCIFNLYLCLSHNYSIMYLSLHVWRSHDVNWHFQRQSVWKMVDMRFVLCTWNVKLLCSAHLVKSVYFMWTAAIMWYSTVGWYSEHSHTLTSHSSTFFFSRLIMSFTRKTVHSVISTLIVRQIFILVCKPNMKTLCGFRL